MPKLHPSKQKNCMHACRIMFRFSAHLTGLVLVFIPPLFEHALTTFFVLSSVFVVCVCVFGKIPEPTTRATILRAAYTFVYTKDSSNCHSSKRQHNYVNSNSFFMLSCQCVSDYVIRYLIMCIIIIVMIMQFVIIMRARVSCIPEV